MTTRPASAPKVRRLVLVPAAASSARDDELVRRYRLARVRQAGREGAAAARTAPSARGG